MPRAVRHASSAAPPPVEMVHEGVPLIAIQLGQPNGGITSINVEAVDTSEVIDVAHRRRAPVPPPAMSC